MNIRRVLVIGATGLLGSPVTEELVLAGFEVTAMVRDRERARTLFPHLHVTWIEGDLQDPDSVGEALEGHDAVYLNLSVTRTEKLSDFHTETHGISEVIHWGQQLGLKRIIYLSSLAQFYKSTWWVFDVKRAAIEMIQESGIPYTLFYPSNFMESIAHQYRMGNRLILLGKPQYPLHWIAARDYGKQVANALIVDQENEEYIVQGPEAISIREAFERFIDYYPHGKLKITRLPMGPMRALAKISRKVQYGVELSKAINIHPETFRAHRTWERLGRPNTYLEEFAEQIEPERETSMVSNSY